ncbi:unnamed protein product, partial [Mycena citricolor]
SNALNDTKGEFTWVGSAYTLSSTAFIPLSGSLSEAFGRRPVILTCIAFFALGSALAGAAQDMNMMIAARTIQGIGGGGIINLTEIVVADLVPLAERGLYQGLIGLVWSFASSIGPPIGGALANRGHKAWRWLFFLNLPLTGIAFVLTLFFLRVKRPEGSTSEKLRQVDWLGNAIVIVGSGLVIIGLTWGGIRYSWASAPVLVPLILGLVLLVAFCFYEATVPAHPTIPLDVIANRTSLSGLLATACHGVVSIALIYYLPVYFQACFGASPIRSAVDILPAALLIAPFGLVGGISVSIVKRYREANWIGWAFTVVGMGVLSTLKATSSVGSWVGFQVVVAVGLGLLFAAPVFAILAPLPPSRAGPALALFSFVRSFFQTWGIAIAGTILQNRLNRDLPAPFVSQFPPHEEIAYIAIPVIKTLDEPLRAQVRGIFADSLAEIWQVMIGIAGLGLLVSLLMREIPMAVVVDTKHALDDGTKDVEMQ